MTTDAALTGWIRVGRGHDDSGAHRAIRADRTKKIDLTAL
jgi:hypothetical protein